MTKTATLNWESPVSYEEIEEKVGPKRGLYQFYGYHPVYDKCSKNALLYIGRTKEDNLRARLLPHEFLGEGVPKILQPDSISIRVAYVPGWDVDLAAVEELLIFMHSPAWNSSGIRYTSEKYRYLEVHNEGDRGGLLEVVKGEDLFD